jgi:hypothetical protein
MHSLLTIHGRFSVLTTLSWTVLKIFGQLLTLFIFSNVHLRPLSTLGKHLKNDIYTGSKQNITICLETHFERSLQDIEDSMAQLISWHKVMTNRHTQISGMLSSVSMRSFSKKL